MFNSVVFILQVTYLILSFPNLLYQIVLRRFLVYLYERRSLPERIIVGSRSAMVTKHVRVESFCYRLGSYLRRLDRQREPVTIADIEIECLST